MSKSWKLGDTLVFYFESHDPTTGSLVDTDSTPTVVVYEDGTSIAGGSPAVANVTTGEYKVTVVATGGNGYAVDKMYSIKVRGGVGAVSDALTIGEFYLSTSLEDDLALASGVNLIADQSAVTVGTATNVNAFTTAAKAEIQSEANDALVALGLDDLTTLTIGTLTNWLSVTVGTNSDKTGYDLSADQSAITIGTLANWNSVNLVADQSAATIGTLTNWNSVTVGTNSDKTGYGLAADQSSVTVGSTAVAGSVTNLVSSDMVRINGNASAAGWLANRMSVNGIDVAANNDKSNYSLAANQSSVTVGTLTNWNSVNLVADQSAVTVGTASNVNALSAAERTAINAVFGARVPGDFADTSGAGSYDWAMAVVGLKHKQTLTDNTGTSTFQMYKPDGVTSWGTGVMASSGTGVFINGINDTA